MYMTYDITVITGNDADLSHVLQHIAEIGGVVKKRIDLGVRPFAYPINKQLEGVYSAFMVDAPAEGIGQLDRALTIDTTVIRHLILTTDSEMSTYQPPKASETQEERMHARDEHPVDVAPKAPQKAPKVPVIVKTKEETTQESQERQKVLDEKLAQILDEK